MGKGSGEGPSAKDVLRAYADVLILAEPRQLRLWVESGLTITQLRVLRRLREGPMSAGALATATGLQPASLSRVIDRLEADGFVSRRTHAGDRRKVEVVLTGSGQAVLGNHFFAGSPIEAAVEAMGADEREAFVRAVSAFVARVRAREEEAGEEPPPRPST